jgi:hypothetical protein
MTTREMPLSDFPANLPEFQRMFPIGLDDGGADA